MRIRIIGLVVLLYGLTGCSGQSTDELPESIRNLDNVQAFAQGVKPEFNIRFNKDRVFGDTDSVFFDRMMDVAVDKNGNVYISDYGKLNIKVFNPDGSYQSTIGREGGGPGEFRHLSDMFIRNNTLYVWDGYQNMAIVFSLPEGIHTANISLGTNENEYENLKEASPSRFYVKPDGTYILEFLKVSQTEELADTWVKIVRKGLFYLMDEKGRLVSEKLFEMNSTTHLAYQIQDAAMSKSTSFYPNGQVAAMNDNKIIAAPGKDFLLKIYDSDGSYDRGIYYPFEHAPLSKEELTEQYSGFFRTGLDLLELPKTWPAIQSMFIDDQDRIWISTIVPDRKIYTWWVLRKDGALLARFDWPRTNNLQTVRGNYMYTRELDEESGIRQAVRYGIELNAK